jgi:magnesium-transporting ATPase (P-type)
MCTGDNIDTATAISRNAGIVNDEEIANNEYACMTGKQFREKVGGLKKITVMKKGEETEVDVVGDMQAFKEVKE